jgi:NADH-quinone oxidoreductase subunit N
MYGSYDVSNFVYFGKALVSLTFLMFGVLLYFYYGGGEVSKRTNFLFNFEAFYLLLLILLASLLIVSCNNFLSFYVNLELQSFILYILVSLNRTSAMSTEAGLKYLVLGALSTGLLLFGISLVYGVTSILNFYEYSIFFRLLNNLDNSIGVLVIVFLGLFFVFFSFFFKFSIFPFHSWTPDVYDGSPTPIMVFVTVFGKFSILFLLVKLLFFLSDLGYLLSSLHYNFITVGWYYGLPSLNSFFIYSGFITIVIGAVGGLVQSRIKRLWGYSAITNLGFIFIALGSFSILGYASAILYLALYIVVNFLFFSFYVSVKFRTSGVWVEPLYLGQFGYFKSVSKIVYVTLCLVLVSFLSFPPLMNFVMKFYVLWTTYVSLGGFGAYQIALLLLANLVASFYYLRLYRFVTVENHSEYSYAPIFYRKLNYSEQLVILFFVVVYFVALLYNNYFYNFLVDLIGTLGVVSEPEIFK